MESRLLILVIIVIGAIAIAQLTRLYELAAKLRKHGEHDIQDRDNYLNARLMLVFNIFQFGALIWLMLKYGWTGRGPAASIEGESTDWLLNVNFAIILAVFFLTNFLLFFFAYKYVRKPGIKATFFPHNNKLELLWTSVPAVVLAVIIILGLQTWNELTAPSDKDALKVELYAQQFNWTARYAGEDNVLGKTDYKLILGSNELGLVTTSTIDSSIHAMRYAAGGILDLQKLLNNRDTVLTDSTISVLRTNLGRKERLLRLLNQMKATYSSANDNAAWNDVIQKDTLYLCKNKPYEFTFRSKDVIHSAFFPHFRQQMNTVPGYGTRLKFTPIYTTKEMRKLKNLSTFNYVLMCNKICGGAHYGMKMMVVVLEEKEYNAWMKAKSGKNFKASFLPAPQAAAAADTTIAKTI